MSFPLNILLAIIKRRVLNGSKDYAYSFYQLENIASYHDENIIPRNPDVFTEQHPGRHSLPRMAVNTKRRS